jgi:hypothetical protein
MHYIGAVSGDGTSNILTISSIPQTFTHLKVFSFTRGVRSFSGEQMYLRFNGDSSANSHAYNYVYGDGSGITQGTQVNTNLVFYGEMPAALDRANIYNATVMDILDYSNSSKNTTVQTWGGWDNNGNQAVIGAKVWLGSGVYNNTAAITSLTFFSNGAFTSDSKFQVYGVTNNPIATGA